MKLRSKGEIWPKGAPRTMDFLFFQSYLTIPLPKTKTAISTNLDDNVRIISNVYWVGNNLHLLIGAMKGAPTLPKIYHIHTADLSPIMNNYLHDVTMLGVLLGDHILPKKPDGSILVSFFMLTFLGGVRKIAYAKQNDQFHSVSPQICIERFLHIRPVENNFELCNFIIKTWMKTDDDCQTANCIPFTSTGNSFWRRM